MEIRTDRYCPQPITSTDHLLLYLIEEIKLLREDLNKPEPILVEEPKPLVEQESDVKVEEIPTPEPEKEAPKKSAKKE